MKVANTVNALDELTGQESGIVVYGNTSALVVNWSSFEGMPKVMMFGPCAKIFSLPQKIRRVKGKNIKASEVVSLLDAIEFIYDANGDEESLRNGEFSAAVYRLGKDTIVVAPHGWI